MHAIFEIIKKDTKAIFHNYAAFVVIIALCILPSLYAWFNIKASWDPYSSQATRGIRIGVVNTDAGTFFQEKEVNIGNIVIDELKKNDQLGWEFVSQEVANEAILDGTYYAVITIPKDFSKDLTSILSTDIKKSEIVYTVNEKINAIAPKLTDKGVWGLKEMISKEVVSTVSGAILEVANEIGVNLEGQIPKISGIYHRLEEFKGKIGTINSTVDSTQEGVKLLENLIFQLNEEMPNIKTTIENAKAFSENSKSFLASSKKAMNQLSPAIKQDMKLISEMAADVEAGVSGLYEAILSNSENAKELTTQMVKKVSSLKNLNDGVKELLSSLDRLSELKPFEYLIRKLSDTSKKLEEGLEILSTIQSKLDGKDLENLPTLDTIIDATTAIKYTTASFYDNYDSKIEGEIQALLEDAYKTAEGGVEILEKAQSRLPEVENFLSIAHSNLDKGEQGIAYVKNQLPQVEGIIDDILSKVGDIDTEKGLEELVSILRVDVEKRTSFLTNPVSIREEKQFPMGNYGTSMAPFYTVLCLWVGCLLMVSILSVGQSSNYRPREVYFGKLLLFMGIGMIQALIVSLGNLYILRIYCMHPWLLIISNVFIACVFVTLVYSLVSILGNVGKVIAIILLVLQVAASGGTFPIQLTPKFFQVLYPFLPFTYGIGLNREMIGGIVGEVLMKDVVVLMVFSIVAIILSVFLKKFINQLLHGFVTRFHESELGE